jgi:hypothetical protein
MLLNWLLLGRRLPMPLNSMQQVCLFLKLQLFQAWLLLQVFQL